MLRKRFWMLWVAAAIVLAWLYYTDPDQGLSTEGMLSSMASAILAVAGAHYALKALFDYREADRRTLFQRILIDGNVGAGLALIAQAIIFVGLLFVFAPRAHAQVPPNAVTYLPMLKTEQMRAWPDHPAPSALASLVEQETCISLKHSRCWAPSAKLKTSREEGAGFGQITRAYNSAGGLRFDTIGAVKALDPDLAALSWANVYSRPDLQMRALVVMNRDCFRRVTALKIVDTGARLAFCDAAYNGGYGGMQSERRACHLVAQCDRQQWFGHVEQHCLKSKAKWQGYGASACDINREHVRNVLIIRRPKYRPYFGEL